MNNLIGKSPFTQFSAICQTSLSFIFELSDDLIENLDSLVVGSVPGATLHCPFTEIEETQLSFARKNGITKVKIESFAKKKEIEYILNLFPRMKYLEVDIKRDTLNVTTALEFILMNRSMKVPHLRSICFNGVKIDRDILDQLRQTIDAETFIRNYHLRCVKNKIFIQWNP